MASLLYSILFSTILYLNLLSTYYNFRFLISLFYRTNFPLAFTCWPFVLFHVSIFMYVLFGVHAGSWGGLVCLPSLRLSMGCACPFWLGA